MSSTKDGLLNDASPNEILVIDDSTANLKLMEEALTAAGYRVRLANEGDLALHSAMKQPPALILLDIRMPGMDGYEVCRRLKADERTRSVPIIFISILEDERDKVKGFREGAVDYITKPFQPEEVLARVQTHLRLRELTERLEQKVAERTGELANTNQLLRQEIADRRRAEESLRRMNRELRAVSNCNQALMMAEDELALLNDVCRIVCEEAGYRMALAGYVETDKGKNIRLVARGGVEDGYFEQAKLTWADTELGRGPAGVSIRSGRTDCTQDISTDPRMAPWREAALKRGYRSAISLPLKDEKAHVFGIFLIYSTEPEAFTPDEIRLLEELAGDLSFGILALRNRIEVKRTEEVTQARLRMLEAAYAPEMSLDDTLRRMLDEIEEHTGSCIGFYHFMEEDQETLSLQNWSTNTLTTMCTAEGKGQHYPVSEAGVWADCVRERRPVVHNDYSSLPDRRGMPEGHAEVIRELVVPVFRGPRIVAIVGVGNKPVEYNGTDVQIVSLLGDFSWEIVIRKKAEERLKESEELLRIILDNILDPVFVTDDVGRFTFVCSNVPITLGYSLEEIRAMGNISALLGKGLFTLEELESQGEIRNIDGAITRKDGVRIDYLVSVKRVSIREGTILYVCRDITERKQAEEALRAGEAFLNTLLNAIPIPVFYKDRDGRYLGFNRAYETFFGATKDQLIGKTVFDISPRELAENYRAKDTELFESGGIQQYESQVKNTHGALRDIIFNKAVFTDSQGTTIGLIGAILDITEHKRAEEERLAHLRVFESLDQVNRAMQGTNDLEQMMCDVLDAVLAIYGCDRAFMLYPCDPEAESWRVPMERTTPEYPGVLALGLKMPMDPDVAKTLRLLLASDGPVLFGPGTPYPLPVDVSVHFGIKSFMSMALHPKVGQPWQFGIHQCSYPRVWTPVEKTLFQEIGWRLSEGLTSLLAYRNLRESEENLCALNDELEQRVKERTAELEEKNAELHKMNRLFVGRELRMAELKERIRALEKKTTENQG